MKNTAQEMIGLEAIDPAQIDLETQISEEVEDLSDMPRLKKRKGANGKLLEQTISIGGININNEMLTEIYKKSKSKCIALVDMYIEKGLIKESEFVKRKN